MDEQVKFSFFSNLRNHTWAVHTPNLLIHHAFVSATDVKFTTDPYDKPNVLAMVEKGFATFSDGVVLVLDRDTDKEQKLKDESEILSALYGFTGTLYICLWFKWSPEWWLKLAEEQAIEPKMINSGLISDAVKQGLQNICDKLKDDAIKEVPKPLPHKVNKVRVPDEKNYLVGGEKYQAPAVVEAALAYIGLNYALDNHNKRAFNMYRKRLEKLQVLEAR